jgi:hypothetical protein
MSVGGVDLHIYKNYKAWEQSGEAGQAATSPARYLCFSTSDPMTNVRCGDKKKMNSRNHRWGQNTDRPAADCSGPFLTTAAIQIDLSVPYLNTSLPRNPTGHRVQKEGVVGGACFRLNAAIGAPLKRCASWEPSTDFASIFAEVPPAVLEYGPKILKIKIPRFQPIPLRDSIDKHFPSAPR